MNQFTLFVVATPIGNLKDITLRAISVLSEVNIILCEDTRQTQKLLNNLEIKNKRLITFNDFNEENVLFEIINLLETGDVALVSDSGTPLISDPGYRLVKECLNRGIKVVPIPGPSSSVASLSVSGLPTDQFMFLGFLPDSKGKRKKLLEQIKSSILKPTYIIFVPPHSLLRTLNELIAEFGDINITIARELTKINEETVNSSIGQLIKSYQIKKVRGEIVVLFNLKEKK